MLVYAAQSNQVIIINNQNFYGKAFGYPPQNISYKLFKTCRDAFEEATYRETDLSKIFNRPCDFVIAFKYSELRFFPEGTLDKIAKWMKCRPYKKTFSTRRKIRIIQQALKVASEP